MTHRIMRLEQAIPNPNVDRRSKRDWTKASVFEPGRYHDNGTSIRQIGGPGYGYLMGKEREWFLQHAVEVQPRNAAELLHVMDMEHLSLDVLEVLLATGAITADQIRATETVVNLKYCD